MKFATKLYLIFATIIIVMIGLLTFFINILNNQSQQMNELVEDRYKKIKIINQIRVEIRTIEKELNSLIVEMDDENDIKHVHHLTEEFSNVSDQLATLSGIITNQSAIQQLNLVKNQFQQYESTVDQVITVMISEEKSKLPTLLTFAQNNKESLVTSIDELIAIQEDIMEATLSESKDVYRFGINIGIFIIIAGIILGFVTSVWVTRAISFRLKKVKDVMNGIQYGSDQLPRININSRDEIGEIADAYNEMATVLENHEKHEKVYKNKIEEQNWLSSKIAELSLLTQDTLDINTLSNKYIQSLVPMVEGTLGIMYLKEEYQDRETLVKLSTYAYSNTGELTSGKETIELGEGLVGQCALDKQMKKIVNIPPDYIKISSALGDSTPKNIIVLPIELDGEIMGVIELASIYEFTDLQVTLLNQAAEQVGIIINRIQRQMQVRSLLEESQTLNEELQSQSEELQLQQEELRTMNEELEAQYRSSEEKTKDLEKAKLALEEKTRQVLLSSQYKSEFLANMSHELRTPLNSLLILAQIFVENQEGNLTDKQREYAHTIYAAGKDLLQLINDILDLSKIESGKSDIHLGEMDIRDVITFTEKQFSHIATHKQLDFKVYVEDTVPGILYSDEQKIYQILKNLLSNAFKFTHEGTVELIVSRREVHSQNDSEVEQYLTLSVKDTGIGISPEKFDLIFEAFQQADGTTSRKYGGTGLGLSISKELANLVGGYITVQSMEGKGSHFTLFIPETFNVQMDSESARREVASTNEEFLIHMNDQLDIMRNESSEEYLMIEDGSQVEGVLEGKHILVVDDDMRNVFALTTALEEAGMNVTFAENGLEALQALSDTPNVDVVLMDVMMPEMDGYEAMRKIRELSEFENLPIIALTAKAMKNDRQKCIDAGASDYISKPVNLEKLFSLLKVWLYK